MTGSRSDNYWIRRHRFGRRGMLAGAGGLVAAVAVGCGDDDDDDAAQDTPGAGGTPGGQASPTTPATKAPKKGGVLNSGLSATGLHFDQQQLAGIAGDGHVYNQLLKLGPGQKILNDLATGFENPEANVYVFKMRPGVKFQDVAPVSGRALTAEDVVYTVERSRTNNPAFTNRWMWTSLTKLEAPDANTVKATFEKPFAAAPYHFAAPSMGVVAKEVVEKFGDLKDAKSRIGSGPFLLADFRKDELVAYKRNPNYFDSSLPYLDEIQARVIPDRLGRIVALRTGQIDLISWQSGVADLDEAKRGMTDVTVETRPSDAVTALGINHANAALGDERVRRAINLSIDRAALVRAAGGENAGIVRGFTHPNGPPFELPAAELAQLTKPDPATAKQLLSQAGQASLELSVTVSSTDVTGLDVAAVMQQQLQGVGIKLTIDAQEYASFIRKLQQKTFELIWIGSWTPALDPSQQFHGSLRSDAAQNWWNAKVTEMNDLDDKAQVELDTNKRAQIVLDMERLNFQKAIALPLYAINGWTAWKNFVKDYDHLRAFNSGGWQNGVTWLDK